jgi:hypothetical protein
MKTKEQQIAAAVDKTFYKVRGKLWKPAKQVGASTWTFVLYKGTGKAVRFFAFTTHSPDVGEVVMRSSVNARFKVRFKIVSKCFNEKWYTDLMCMKIDNWLIGEGENGNSKYLQQVANSLFD